MVESNESSGDVVERGIGEVCLYSSPNPHAYTSDIHQSLASIVERGREREKRTIFIPTPLLLSSSLPTLPPFHPAFSNGLGT